MTKCKMCQISNDNKEDIYHQQLIFCQVFEVSGPRMNSLSPICGYHCLRTLTALDKIAHMLLRGEIVPLDTSKVSWVNYLEGKDRQNMEMIQHLTGKSYKEIKADCNSCQKQFVSGNNYSIIAHESYSMSGDGT